MAKISNVILRNTYNRLKIVVRISVFGGGARVPEEQVQQVRAVREAGRRVRVREGSTPWSWGHDTRVQYSASREELQRVNTFMRSKIFVSPSECKGAGRKRDNKVWIGFPLAVMTGK